MGCVTQLRVGKGPDRHMGPIEEQVEAELVLVSVRTPYFADA
jgi:hypothetical protein